MRKVVFGLLGMLLGANFALSQPNFNKFVRWTSVEDKVLDDVSAGYSELREYKNISGQKIILWDEAKMTVESDTTKGLRIEYRY